MNFLSIGCTGRAGMAYCLRVRHARPHEFSSAGAKPT